MYPHFIPDTSDGPSPTTPRLTLRVPYESSSCYSKEKKLPSLPPRSTQWPTLWLLELLSASLSLVCIGGVVSYLYSIDNRAYNSWTVATIDLTPNTLLSLLATITKAAFLLPLTEGISQLKWTYFQVRERKLIDLQTFDFASRGPLGALKLLWSVNYRAVLASCGALITILALLTDPLTNQIITVQTRPTLAASDTATITSANTYGLHARDHGSVTSGILADAMVRGIYAPDLQVDYSCPTGACSWPSFDSLAMCSTCEDLTDDVEVSCSGCGAGDLESQAIHCNYTTPGGINTTVQFNDVGGQLVSSWLLQTLVWDLGSTVSNKNNASESAGLLMNESGGIVDISMLRLSDRQPLDGQSLRERVCGAGTNANLRPNAYQCTLGWCINSYASSAFDGGQLTDSPTSSAKLNIADEHCYLPHVDPPNIADYICPVTVEGTTIPASPVVSDPYYLSNNSNVYWINDRITTDTQTYIDSTFNFDMESPLVDAQAMQQTFYTANNGNLSQTMDDIARSMTNQIRQGPESRPVNGSATTADAFVKVRWAWLTYLATLSVLAAVFLLAVIVGARYSEAPIWKSSLLPLLPHHAYVPAYGEKNDASLGDLEEAARKVEVSLADLKSLGSRQEV